MRRHDFADGWKRLSRPYSRRLPRPWIDSSPQQRCGGGRWRRWAASLSPVEHTGLPSAPAHSECCRSGPLPPFATLNNTHTVISYRNTDTYTHTQIYNRVKMPYFQAHCRGAQSPPCSVGASFCGAQLWWSPLSPSSYGPPPAPTTLAWTPCPSSEGWSDVWPANAWSTSAEWSPSIDIKKKGRKMFFLML